MIGWLSGTIRNLEPTGTVLLDTGGIGYDICVSLQTLCRLREGGRAELMIHTYVREDQITLFGFLNSAERSLFRKLNMVSGVGARMALNLMSGMAADELIRAIENGDDPAIARTPGIGKKTAQRLILELQGKLDTAATASGGERSHNDDLRSALGNLGYKPAQVDSVLRRLEPGDFETMFRAALKELG